MFKLRPRVKVKVSLVSHSCCKGDNYPRLGKKPWSISRTGVFVERYTAVPVCSWRDTLPYRCVRGEIHCRAGVFVERYTAVPVCSWRDTLPCRCVRGEIHCRTGVSTARRTLL